MEHFMESSVHECTCMWLSQAKFEASKQRSLRHQRGSGTCTLLILDVSESMRGRGFREMKAGVMDILDEFIDNGPRLDENVSVIVCGQETKFLHYYSNRYAAIKRSIEELECSGPSPLTAAFLLALGGVFDGAAYISQIGSFILHPRIAVFTDGKITDFSNLNARDSEVDYTPGDCLIATLCSHTYRIGANHPIFCFPVGENPNYELLHAISSFSNGGKVLEIREAKRLARYVIHYSTADRVSKATRDKMVERENLRFVAEFADPDEAYDEDDLDIIYELVQNRERILGKQNRIMKEEDDDDDLAYKEKYSTVPCLGTRVCRGPHWRFQNQDSEGNGTIVGHGDKVGAVLVEWDSGTKCTYNYGVNDVYDIVICDEPRISADGLVAVGCFVKRGPDWKWEEQDGGEGSIGTAYRVMDNATVYVRWPSGLMGNYRFGYDGKYDVEVCDPFSPDVKKAVKEQRRASEMPDSIHTNVKGKCASNGSKTKSKESRGKTEDMETVAWLNEKSDLCSKGAMLQNETSVDSTETRDFYRPKSRIRGGRTASNDMKNTNDSITELQGPMEVDDLQTDSVSNISPNSDIQTGEAGSSGNITRTVSPNAFQNTLFVKQNRDSGGNQATVSDVTIASNYGNEIQRNESMTNQETGSNITPILKNVGSKHCSTNSSRCWQWRDSDGVWVNYPDHVNGFINHRLQLNPRATVVINHNDQRLVATRMIQVNIDTKETHDVRLRNT